MSLGLGSIINVTHPQLCRPVTESPLKISCNLTFSHIHHAGVLLSEMSSCWVGNGMWPEGATGSLAVLLSQGSLSMG